MPDNSFLELSSRSCCFIPASIIVSDKETALSNCVTDLGNMLSKDLSWNKKVLTIISKINPAIDKLRY